MNLDNTFILVKSHREQVAVELVLNAVGIYHTAGMFGMDISKKELGYYSVSCIHIKDKTYWYSDTLGSEYVSSLSMAYEEFIGLNL